MNTFSTLSQACKPLFLATLVLLIIGCSGTPTPEYTPSLVQTPTPESLVKDHKAQGEIALESEYWEAAAKSFENAKAIKGDDIGARERLIYSYHKADNKLSRNSRAYREAQELLKMDPDNKRAKSFVGELKAVKDLKKAESLLHKHKYAEAKALLLKTKKLSPDSAGVRYALFEALANLEKPSPNSAAYKEAKTALDFGLEGPQAYYAELWIESVDNGMTSPGKSFDFMMKTFKGIDKDFAGILYFIPKDKLIRGKRNVGRFNGKGRHVSEDHRKIAEQLAKVFQNLNVQVLGETVNGDRAKVRFRASFSDGSGASTDEFPMRKEDGLWKMGM